MIYQFTLERKVIEELSISVEYPDYYSTNDVINAVRIDAAKSNNWKKVLTDLPEIIECEFQAKITPTPCADFIAVELK